MPTGSVDQFPGDEPPGAVVDGVLEDPFGCPDFGEPVAEKDPDPVGDPFGLVHVVGRDDDADVAVAGRRDRGWPFR